MEESEELVIKNHSFEHEQEQLQEVLQKATPALELEAFKTKEGFCDWFDHKITGEEMNVFSKNVGKYLIALNERNLEAIKGLGHVYNALDSLDKDYIAGIIIGVKSAQEASKQAKDAQKKNGETIVALRETVKQLETFRAQILKYRHLDDIDTVWDSLQYLTAELPVLETSLEEEIAVLTADIQALQRFQENLEKQDHLTDMDTLWLDVQQIKQSAAGSQGELETLRENTARVFVVLQELQDFQRDTQALAHLADIDELWAQSQADQEQLAVATTEIETHAQQIQALETHADNITADLTLCKERTMAAEHLFEQQKDTDESDRQKIQYQLMVSYAIAGSAIFLTVLQFVLQMAGML